jgi:hypothetical protein
MLNLDIYDINWQYDIGERVKYRGQVNEKGKPNGLGCMGYFDEDGTLQSLYVGEFQHSQLHGRGYVVEHTIKRETLSTGRRATVEDVMMSAGYDECGRPFVYPVSVGDIIGGKEVVVHNWTVKRDGVWQNGKFVQAVNRNFKRYADQRLYSLTYTYYQSAPNERRWMGHKSIRLGEISKSGIDMREIHNAIFTPLSDGRLMVHIGESIFAIADEDIVEVERCEDTVYRHYYFSLQPIGLHKVDGKEIVEVKRNGVRYVKFE